MQGIITPNTPLETDTGHSGLAGQIPGLFDGLSPPASTIKPPASPSVTAPNYFYNDAYGQRQGPVSAPQLKKLAVQGIITPNTPLETDTGKKGNAGQIRGLFPTIPTSVAQPTQTAEAITQCFYIRPVL